MAVPYHTHEFTLPTATLAETEARIRDDVAASPASLVNFVTSGTLPDTPFTPTGGPITTVQRHLDRIVFLDLPERASAAVLSIPESVTDIYVKAFSLLAPGKGGARYTRRNTVPAHNCWFQSVGGAYWELNEPNPNADMTGLAAAITPADRATAINNLFGYVDNGTVTIPAGSYDVGDITIAAKNVTNKGVFRVIATGVIFTSANSLIINSCKRVELHGFDAALTSLHWRGCWFSDFYSCRFKEIVHGEVAGTSFSSAYWNNFFGGQMMGITTHANATEPMNAITFYGVPLRATGQGFSGTRSVAIILNANQNTQGISFVGGDISYHDKVLDIGGANTSEISISFDRVYFDSVFPLRDNYRAKTRIVTRDCHAANEMPIAVALGVATQGGQQSWNGARSASWLPWMDGNLVPNGNLAAKQASYVGTFLQNANTATVTEQVTSGFAGRYLNISQAKTTGNVVYFGALATKFKGRHTATLLLRHAGAGEKTLRVFFGPPGTELYATIKINTDRVTRFTLTTDAEIDIGVVPTLAAFTDDGTAFNIDVFYAGIVYGETPSLAPTQHPQADWRDEVRAVQVRPGTAAIASKPIWTSGTGSPEAVVTAVRGSLFTREDGGALTTLYIKETGTGNTGWVAK